MFCRQQAPWTPVLLLLLLLQDLQPPAAATLGRCTWLLQPDQTAVAKDQKVPLLLLLLCALQCA